MSSFTETPSTRVRQAANRVGCEKAIYLAFAQRGRAATRECDIVKVISNSRFSVIVTENRLPVMFRGCCIESKPLA